MMKGKMTCPICAGTGKITEDSQEYEFQTRDPHSETCLTCSGSGLVAPRKRLPDGRAVCEIEPKEHTQVKLNDNPKAEREPVTNSLNHESMNNLAEVLKGLHKQLMTVKVTVLHISGTRAEVLETIKEII